MHSDISTDVLKIKYKNLVRKFIENIESLIF